MVIKRIITISTICLVIVAFTIPCFASGTINDDTMRPQYTPGGFFIGVSEARQEGNEPSVYAWLNANGPFFADPSNMQTTFTYLVQQFSQDLEEFNPHIYYPTGYTAPTISVIDNMETIKYQQRMRFDSNRDDIADRDIKFVLTNLWNVPGDMTENGTRQLTRNLKVSAVMSTLAILKNVEVIVNFRGERYNYSLASSEYWSEGYIIDTSVINCNRIQSELEVEFDLEHNELAREIIVIESLTYTVGFQEFPGMVNNAYFNIVYDLREYPNINDIIEAKGSEISLPDSKNPVGYTNWLGTAVSGFFNTEILPGFSFGGILLMVMSFLCVVWFLKIFAGG